MNDLIIEEFWRQLARAVERRDLATMESGYLMSVKSEADAALERQTQRYRAAQPVGTAKPESEKSPRLDVNHE